MKTIYLTTIAFIVLLSCSKKKTDDKESPIISFTAPVNNQVFTAGEIHIKGNVNDNQYIEGVHIEISNNITGEEYDHIHIHPGSKTYVFDQTFILKAGISYKIKVIAEDPSANPASVQAAISCN